MSRHPPTRSGSRGSPDAFTLTEVLVALALLVVTISLFLNSFNKARQSAMLVDNRMRAINFARMNLETLLTNSYSSANISITNRPNWTTNVSISGGTTSQYFCGYAVVTGQFAKSRTILLTNSWYDLVARRTNTVSLSTAVCSGFLY